MSQGLAVLIVEEAKIIAAARREGVSVLPRRVASEPSACAPLVLILSEMLQKAAHAPPNRKGTMRPLTNWPVFPFVTPGALPTRARRPLVFLIVLALLVALTSGLAYFQFVVKPNMVKGFMAAAFAPKPTTVTVEAAKIEKWPPS